MVGDTGLEPVTGEMPAGMSSGNGHLVRIEILVGDTGLEPVTSAMS